VEHRSTHSPAKPSVRFSVVDWWRRWWRRKGGQVRKRSNTSAGKTVSPRKRRAFDGACALSRRDGERHEHTHTHTHPHPRTYTYKCCTERWVGAGGKRCVCTRIYTELETDGRQLFIARRRFKGVSGALPRARHLSR